MPKGIIDYYHIIINIKNFYDQAIDSGIKRYKEIRNSAPSLNRIDIINYFNYEPRFNGVSSRNSLPRTKDRAYVIKHDDKKT